jgi:hypothetical protein
VTWIPNGVSVDDPDITLSYQQEGCGGGNSERDSEKHSKARGAAAL